MISEPSFVQAFITVTGMDEFKDTQRCYVLEQEEGILQE